MLAAIALKLYIMETFISFDLFISHNWHNSIEYMRIVEMLNDAPHFYWRNYSTCEKDPIIKLDSEYGKTQLKNELEEQIKYVNLLIICADLYAENPYWIDQQIAIADRLKKPYIVLKPYNNQTMPHALSLNARALLKWDANAIITAIKTHAL